MMKKLLACITAAALAAFSLPTNTGAQTTKRLRDLPTVTSPTAGDLIPLDGASSTRNIAYENLFTAALLAQRSLTPAADRCTYFSGGSTAALATCVAFGRSLLAAADAAAARTLLGVVIGTDVQAYHVNLAAISGLSTAANKLTYWTGSGAAALTDLSAFIRTLLDDADATTARATLGISIGSAVQAWDADLDCVAALSGTGLIRRTGAGTCSNGTTVSVTEGGTGITSGTSGGIPYFSGPTAIASSGVLGANQIVLGGGAGVAPTVLSCGTSTTILHGGTPPTCSQLVYADIASAALAATADYYAATASKLVPAAIIYPSEVTITYGTTTTIDFDTLINGVVTLTGNITTMTLSNVKAGKGGTIRLVQDATGSRTAVFSTTLKFAGGAVPTLSTSANAVDVLTYYCQTTTFCTASLAKDVRNP